MRASTSLVFAALTLLAVSCSPIYVEHSFADYADFSQYKTYSWLPVKKADGMITPPSGESTLAALIRTAIERELDSKGLEKVDADGDLRVTYQLGNEFKTDVRYPYYGGAGMTVRVDHISEGTLVVDLIDERDVIMWEGVAENAKRVDASTDERYRTIDKAIEKLFRNYPPKK